MLELLDADHVAFAAYRYDIYGRPTATQTRDTNAVSSAWASAIAERNLLRYSGYAWDVHSGLYYVQRRYYDPTTRAFLARDPLRADGDESPYQYCGGNPVELIDPEGLEAKKAGAGAAWYAPNNRNTSTTTSSSSSSSGGTGGGAGVGASDTVAPPSITAPSTLPKFRGLLAVLLGGLGSPEMFFYHYTDVGPEILNPGDGTPPRIRTGRDSGRSWWTDRNYDNPEDAQRGLGLKRKPRGRFKVGRHRLGNSNGLEPAAGARDTQTGERMPGGDDEYTVDEDIPVTEDDYESTEDWVAEMSLGDVWEGGMAGDLNGDGMIDSVEVWSYYSEGATPAGPPMPVNQAPLQVQVRVPLRVPLRLCPVLGL